MITREQWIEKEREIASNRSSMIAELNGKIRLRFTPGENSYFDRQIIKICDQIYQNDQEIQNLLAEWKAL